MENINNKIKILLIFSMLLFTSSCINNNERSFNSLFLAFNKWFFIHHPEISNNFDSYTFYIKNKKGDLDYLNEYSFDIKRFNLELSQIQKENLTKNSYHEYISLNEKLNSLSLKYQYQDYNIDPSYYIESLNWYFMNLLLSESISNNDKILLINDTFNHIFKYIERTKKNFLKSNDYLIDKSLNKINLTIDLLENIPNYIDLTDTVLIDLENKISKNTNLILSYKNWLQTKLKKEEDLTRDHMILLLNNHIMDVEKKYNYRDILNHLEKDIKKIRKKIFNASFSLNNKEIEKDTVSLIIDLINEPDKKNNIYKDYSSRIINFNNRYKEILSFLESSRIVYNIDILDINFPHYNMMFDNFDDSFIIANPYYNNPKLNLIINSSNNSNLSKRDIDFFIIEEILSRTLYKNNNNNMRINIYNDVNHYAWGKILSEILIKNGYSSENYQLFHDIRLLHDFAKIFIKYKYYTQEITEKEAMEFLLEHTFLDIDSSNRFLSEITYEYSENNLEYYAAYKYVENLFNTNCIISNKMTDGSFIKKIFKYGFLPVYNYKSILN